MSTSVADLTNIVVSIQDESNIVTVSLQDGYKEVKQGTSQIQKIRETFAGINSAVTEMANNIKTVSENLPSIASNSEKINESISEIAAISEESAAGVEQSAASSQQISSAMEEASNSSNDLVKLAEKLNRLVHQFKL